ncbi:MAG: amino acid kinase family protein, partial [Promethearchaeota archaeon]
TTTLGRGGSDFTATILARCLYDLNWLNKGKIILWKDVAGILSGNPTYIQNPNLIKRLYYVEAKAIAALGAKVLNPKCRAIIEQQKIPVEIRKFEVPSADLSKFTLISQAISEDKIKGISVIDTKSVLSIESPTLLMEPSFIAAIFDFFASHNISSILCHESITQDSISFLIDEEIENSTIDLFQDSIKLSTEWIQVHRYDVGVISLIVDQAYYFPIFNHITTQFIQQHISPLSFLLSPTNTHISFIVPREDTLKIANVINEICREISDTTFNEPIVQTPNVKDLEVKH